VDNLDWLSLVYLLAVLVLVWPAVRLIRAGGNTLVHVAVWLAALVALVAGYTLWQG
jgi:hypothetical protein